MTNSMNGSASSGSVADDVLTVAHQLQAKAPNDGIREQAQAIIDRLAGPLRVAIAGRVKAGKSTLLNALVGERLAPTDAGECTRIVSCYRRGSGYSVTAHLRNGSTQPLAFNRTGGSLDIQLGALTENDIATLDVTWPTTSLETITLIDTPGLASINDENSRRTREFLEHDGDKPSDADAVVYLMRHAHRSDVAFLDAFMDRTVTAASPVNAVAVLSRADEIGAGRLDAMESSARIARRYETDPQLRGLCAAVVPLAGLLAETGLTLREDEVGSLRMLANTDPAVLEQMLLSADQFCDTSNSELTVEWRRNLLDRLGMFGVRVALREVQSGRATTAAALGPILVAQSGLGGLRELLVRHFAPRARVLQARSALIALRSLVRSVAAVAPDLAAEIDRELERIEASTVQFAQVRAAHMVSSGSVNFNATDTTDLERLFSGTGPATALGLMQTSPPDEIASAALASINRWRTRGADPLADPSLVEVCEVAVRTCESFYAMVAAAH